LYRKCIGREIHKCFPIGFTSIQEMDIVSWITQSDGTALKIFDDPSG
jgi:hypothetical protein